MATRPILIGDDTGGVLRGFAPEPVSLSALKAAGVPIEWHEGVAIILEAARRLLESKSRETAAELSGANVRIDLTGAVVVPRDGVQDGPAAVSQLGALLRDVLPDNLPVPLRLAVSQAMSNPPHYASIASFSDALSYFERPDAASTIRAVYERWEANGATQPTPHVRHQAARSIEPVSEEPDPEEPVTKQRTAAATTPRWLLVAGGIGLIITLTLVLAAVMLRNSGGQSAEREAELDALTAQPDGSTTGDAPVVKADQPDVTRHPSAAPAESAATTPATNTTRPAPAPRLNTERPATRAVVRPAQPVASADDARAPAVAPRRAAVQPPASAAHPPVLVTVLETAPGSQIYSALDADVAAPLATYPQSPTVATVLHDDEVITFDVVIDETGKVESVKLRRAPSTIRSTLMLTMSMSVAKAWRFQPAMRNGQSVKYRQSISVPAPQ